MHNEITHDSHAHIETVLVLPRHADVFTLAHACRDAALAFVNDSDHWGPAELAMWLFGPYAQLTDHVPPQSNRGRETPRLPLLREIDASHAERLLREARVEVRNTLETMLEAEGAASFAYNMLANGMVVQCEDTHEAAGWAPTRAAQRLADRVLSLFAADYLTRPDDYELELSVCSLCRTIEFDVEGRFRAACSRHRSREESFVIHESHMGAGRYATLPLVPKLAA